MSGGLFDPLGTDRTERSRGGSRPAAPVVAAALAVTALVALLAVSWLRDDGDRGRPVAVAPIEHVQVPPKPPAIPLAPPASAPAPAATVPALPPASAASTASGGLPPVSDDQEVEVQNGVRIIRPRRDGSGGQTIRVPDAKGQR